MQGLFVTGTDTEVGKTEVAAAIAHLLRGQKYRVVPRKPVASGCVSQADKTLMCEDTQALIEASGTDNNPDMVTPFAFEDAVAPDLAARRAGTPITITQLQDAVLRGVTADDFLLVEGAGGVYSPMAEDGLCADLAKRLKLPAVLVVRNRLGCINHALLALNVLQQEGIALHSVIVNDAAGESKLLMDNMEAIKKFSGAKIFQLSHFPEKRTRWPKLAGLLRNQGWQL